MSIKYVKTQCHTCDMDILVPENDMSTRNYCYTCAMVKLGVTS